VGVDAGQNVERLLDALHRRLRHADAGVVARDRHDLAECQVLPVKVDGR
jgi:hypothetical protein